MVGLPQFCDDSTRTVRCPKCGSGQDVAPVTVLRPGDAGIGTLFKGQLNQVRCSTCSVPFLLDVPILFRDDERLRLVYFIPLDDPRQWPEAEERMKGVTGRLFPPDDWPRLPVCRLTVTRRTFVEKITLFMGNVDDRIVEYLKFQLYQRSENKIDPIRTELLYDFSSNGGDRLAFLLFDRETGQPTAAAHYPMDVYADLVSMFLDGGEMEAELGELFPGYYVSVERLLL